MYSFCAAKLISGAGSSSVYDYSQSRYINISGSVSHSSVTYRPRRKCYFGGNPPSFYDYGRGVHVSLNINGDQFTGYDYGDRHHFSGTVSGNSVSIYDYGESLHFSYSV
jgi:hypothetical protein